MALAAVSRENQLVKTVPKVVQVDVQTGNGNIYLLYLRFMCFEALCHFKLLFGKNMDSVKVALRIRPLVNSEIEIGCRACIERIPNEPQITIGKGCQMFTFNYVFDENEGQIKVYDEAVKPLIDNLFKGYNVTILAYGQTGSGKTYTMGTNYSGEEELGIIPRAVYDIFNRINTDLENEIKVTVTFIELYNESLFDLLTQKPREQSIVEMREVVGGICIPGLTEIEVNSPNETLNKLKEGSAGRVVGSTAMNAQSSRSHAIFTISIRIVDKNNIVNSKFHLVDLAGSERSKKTGTTGERFKEGVNINKGLLVLGNVISQLCEGNHSYINYRDSKLTRLLQDSLGGNSVTLMIACASPADYNQDETLSTLRYADRARKIKNKPIVNLDPQLAEISRLRRENEELRLKMIGGDIPGCPPEHQCLQDKLTDASKKINELSKVLGAVLSQNTNMFEKTLSIESAESALKIKLNELFKLVNEGMSNDEPHWNEVKTKIVEVQDEQQKLESEICSIDRDYVKQNDEKEDNTEVEIQDDVITKHQDHILLQAQINNEILTLSKNLKWKEELVEQLTENTSTVSIDELKKQLVELQQEKEELLKQMGNNTQHAQNSSAKLAENRRKRLLELETKVSALTKKVAEQERIIKLKEKSEEKIKKLRQEIVEMKQLKVKLIQQMKTENDKFKTFKVQKDREVCQLKNQNMKKQNELKRMEQMHVKQQNVLRRKLEAAAAANKRVMAALERQKAAKDKKSKGSSSEKIKERMTEELELLESEYQAQKSLDYLMLDRAALSKELAVIKISLADKSISDEEKIKLKTDAKEVEYELELRTVEISDLQQKLIDIHQDDQTRSYWDVIQSMADAKCALSHLYNITSEKIIESLNKSALLNEVMDQQAETEQQLDEYKMRLSDFELYHKQTIEKLERQCEEKVNDIIKLAAETKEGVLSETFRIDSKEPDKPEIVKKMINEIEEENYTALNNKQEVKKNSENLDDNRSLYGLNGSAIDDPSKDPDWREDTPIHKRLQALKFSQSMRKRGSSNDEKCACIDGCADDCRCINSFFSCNRNCPCDLINCLSSKRLKPISRVIDFNYDGSKQSTNLN